MDEFAVVEIPPGTTLDGADGWMLAGWARLDTLDRLDAFCHDDMAWSAREIAADFAHTTMADHRWAVLVSADEPRVPRACVKVDLPTRDNTNLAEISVLVEPAWRRQGLGTQALAWAEGIATASGRTMWLSYIEAGLPDPSRPQVSAPEGGSIAADLPGWRFAQRHGYVLEQIERFSALELPLDPAQVAAWMTEVGAHSDGYRLHTWVGDIPHEWRAGYAALLGSFNTAAPLAGLAVEDEVWDEARVQDMLDHTAARGRVGINTAAEHIATGTLVAVTELGYPAAPRTIAFQGLTLVTPAHRGHRLGLAVKLANLAELARRRPDVVRIYTSNAAENAPMLAINIQLGSHWAGVLPILQKRVGVAPVDVG